MAKKVTDESIIAALMSSGTIKDAAAAIGITERTIYDRMNNPTFKDLYNNAKADVVRKAIFSINNHIGAAVDSIVAIMVDESVNPAIRLQAAQTILNNTHKFAERLSTEEEKVIEDRDKNFLSFL